MMGSTQFSRNICPLGAAFWKTSLAVCCLSIFSHFCCPLRYHGLNSLQTPTGEWESGSLAAGSEEEHLAMQMAELSQLSRLWGAGSDLSGFLHALGQLVTNPK